MDKPAQKSLQLFKTILWYPWNSKYLGDWHKTLTVVKRKKIISFFFWEVYLLFLHLLEKFGPHGQSELKGKKDSGKIFS